MQTFIKVIDRSSDGKCGKINSNRNVFGAIVALGVPIKKRNDSFKAEVSGLEMVLGRDDPGVNRETIPVNEHTKQRGHTRFYHFRNV